ncbi:MAG: long-chain fatty acid--CoA ligase [Muribaculaceae bacterium]|nr:long-chain fatty acid--CoA ligase [Muribaculaceae bacterium]
MSNVLTNLIKQQLERYGNEREAFSTIDVAGKRLVPTTWAQLSSDVDNVAAALAVLGVEPGNMIASFTGNCAEFIITDFACYRNRAVPVAIYATSSPEQVSYIVRDAGAKLIFVGDAGHYRIARDIISECPTLSKIIIINQDVELDADDTDSLRFSELVELGSRADASVHATVALRTAEAMPDDIATLIYTSGTTGEPKGAILTQDNFSAALAIHHQRLDTISDEDTSVCFLPLCHIFERAWTYFCLSKGIRVAINNNPREIQTALPIACPSCMCSVPRFWEKAYTAIMEKLAGMKGMMKKLVDRALKVGARRNLEYVRLGLRVPRTLEMEYKLYDRLVFSKVRRTIGIQDRNFFPTAGAPLSSAIVEFLHTIGINIVIGYGLSETTATVSCFPSIGYEIGSVGTPMPEVQVKIGPNNEILVKGPTVMHGYYGRPEENAKVFTEDGWFRTGDAGLFDHTGALVLTERIKDLFKTSNGKYIAPQAIESRLGQDRYIEQVAVIGDQRKYVTAIIIPAFDALKAYAHEHGIDFANLEELVKNSEIRRFIGERIETLQKGLAGFEKIKRFTLLPKEFTIENGELTNTLKIRRRAINERYANEIEAMYG